MADSVKSWREFTPKEAAEQKLHCDGENIKGPMNEAGEECPWPWEPEQLAGAPLGQYHCSYCGGMQVAGIPHMDWDKVELEEMYARHETEEG